ncbi:DUF4326 domain-containing protein [Actinacidiphila sp. ITFR-21]|uniref:DUF4326 domain-containing protein n=1 Tax=Actinacidiphila sp. ITFR-21 TaxID=3075199 RepID=UPI00288B123D|nr:DUF4326 domain-containing protein [Streptomyces sp. ITFR-21]WNI19151.1 DUF4326 domain-containing protein [Streptomyces sp. ITFR-21]
MTETSTPARIRRKHTAGWRAPLDAQARPARYVGRGTRYGNPWVIAETDTLSGWTVNWAGIGRPPTGLRPEIPAHNQRDAHTLAVELFEVWVHSQPDLLDRALRELAGRDLMCWCPASLPCHADVLLALANPTPA